MFEKLYIVGLTGPTGSGKSEVARVFGDSGIPVIDADELARKAVEPGTECLDKLVSAFSDDILNPDRTLNRKELARRAFATPQNTELLNSITHPYIIEMMKSILMHMEREGERSAVLDAPLLFESGLSSICDLTIAVFAPYEMRLKRILARDRDLSEQDARARMASQKPERYYASRASVIIRNHGDLSELREKAGEIARDIRERAHEK